MNGETATPTVYDIRVAGHLDDHWGRRLGGLTITRHGDGTSVLTGHLVDQAQLHGVLAGLRDIGATLLEVGRADPATPPQAPRALDHPLRTERLTLRPATAADAEATWAFRRLGEVSAWLTSMPTDVAAYRSHFAEPRRLATTVVVQLGHEPTGPVIGDLMLRREDAWAQREVEDQAAETEAEIGWVLDPVHTGRGYATEAVRELLRVAFEDHGLRRVVANCFYDNEASWRLMERVGMRRETHAVRDSLHRSGRWLDSLAYALLAEEWRKATDGAPRV